VERRLDTARRRSLTALRTRREAVAYAEAHLRRAGAPRGLAFVAAIESGFRRCADAAVSVVSGNSADRARQFGLVVTTCARRPPDRRSRRAAARHPALRERYDDWRLALAAIPPATPRRRGATRPAADDVLGLELGRLRARPGTSSRTFSGWFASPHPRSASG
jgi:hypothetical protein